MSVSVEDHMRVQMAVKAYQSHGHLFADIDPLELWKSRKGTGLPEGFGDSKMLYILPEETFVGRGKEFLTANETVDRLRNTYRRAVGIEFKHLVDAESREWIARKAEETMSEPQISLYDRRYNFGLLAKSHLFEKFLEEKRPEEARFGLQGCQVLVPALRTILDSALDKGAQTFNIAMGRRGRPNVLANILEVSVKKIFEEFSPVRELNAGSGDKIYNGGANVSLVWSKGQKRYEICLVPGPSHFELANCLALGKTKAQQFHQRDTEGLKNWPILLHGDAIMYAQGMTFESLQMYNLPCFTTRGTIHLIIDNQIGLQTLSRRYKGSEYCSDVGMTLGIPIFHVNGDDVDAVIHVVNMATEFRVKFKKIMCRIEAPDLAIALTVVSHSRDVIIDLVCYRRHGFDEDVPKVNTLVQDMYKRIGEMRPVYEKYRDALLKEKVITVEDVQSIEKEYRARLETEMAEPKQNVAENLWILSPQWDSAMKRNKKGNPFETGVDTKKLEHIAVVSSQAPKDFNLNRSLSRVLKHRMEMIEKNSLDWSLCESLAIGSLLLEGHHVRFCGEDVQRGTFSHRHHVWHDMKSRNKTYVPLHHLDPGQAPYTTCNSLLSEMAVLGFEYGYSTYNPNDLVIWEAQFGDFLNTAQPMVDCYLSSGEARWKCKSGLVVLLPHGMEGQGPEHSSGRPERILQLCSEADGLPEGNMLEQLRVTNMIVTNIAFPANYFHALRRQLKMPFTKPLVVFSPKSLLRHPRARSPFEFMAAGTEFQPYLSDEKVEPKEVRKVLLCTGKVYHELCEERKAKKLEGKIAIGLVEQLCPFPFAQLREDLARFPNARLAWVQEEHKNQGWWSYVSPRIHSVIGDIRIGHKTLEYIGRTRAAAPATGNKVAYNMQRAAMMKLATTLT